MNEREKSPYEGLALAAAFWLWGSLIWLAPGYIGFSGVGSWACNIVGGILIAISFGGAAIEIGQLFKSRAFEWWGVGMIFLVPAGLLHLTVWYAELGSLWSVGAKSMALLLDAFGGTFVLLGLAYLFWNGPPVDSSEDTTPEASAERVAEQKRRRRQYTASAGVFLLSIISAILKSFFGFG